MVLFRLFNEKVGSSLKLPLKIQKQYKNKNAQATLYRKSKLFGKRVDQYELPHLDLHCLQIQIFSFLAIYV